MWNACHVLADHRITFEAGWIPVLSLSTSGSTTNRSPREEALSTNTSWMVQISGGLYISSVVRGRDVDLPDQLGMHTQTVKESDATRSQCEAAQTSSLSPGGTVSIPLDGIRRGF